MKVLKDGRIQVRVKITGTFEGKPWEYTDPTDDEGSQYIWPNGDPSTYWWSEGNMACDCNRRHYAHPGKDLAADADNPCGDTISIDRIEPVEGEDLPTLVLNETTGESFHPLPHSLVSLPGIDVILGEPGDFMIRLRTEDVLTYLTTEEANRLHEVLGRMLRKEPDPQIPPATPTP